MQKTHFQTIIIGKGLVGSAAAKYLAQNGAEIALIGPDEPQDYQTATVFASHYDAARVQRVIGKDAIWTRLNHESAQAYKDIEQQSSIAFYNPVGCLYVNPYGKDAYLQNVEKHCAGLNLTVKKYTDAVTLNLDFQDFTFPTASQGMFEPHLGGYIKPRHLIAAQLAIFEQNKGVVLKETVLDLNRTNNFFTVKVREGNVYTAEKVLLTMGSFLNCFDFLPQKLALRSKSEVVLLAKLSPETARRYESLPSLLYEIDNGDIEGVYMTPPVQYPDGDFYLKLGCNTSEDIFFDNLAQIQAWFRHAEVSHLAKKQIQALRDIMPQFPLDAYFVKKCIISRTAHGRPYIGETAQTNLYVAGGCNGYSAMCSDAMGAATAHLMSEKVLPQGFYEKDFELVYSNQ